MRTRLMENGRARLVLSSLALLALAGCTTGLDMGGFNLGGPADPPANVAARPEPDSRGIITYPSYQVVLAKRGDTVSSVAARIGLGAEELAKYNGLKADTPLRDGELLALPRKIDGTGDGLDITAIATQAIDKANRGNRAASPTDGGTGFGAPAPNKAIEPIRHRVERGETAYSIARLYGVSVTALASWNRLGPDLAVHEGQQLLIPIVETPPPAPPVKPATLPRDTTPPAKVAQAPIAPPADVAKPGQGSPTPVPPSADKPLPPATGPVTEPPSPKLSQYQSKTATTKFLMPVEGNIISPYTGKKGGNEGIDIAAMPGTAVLAAADGTVALISKSVAANTIVLIRHGGNLFTVYSNVTDVPLAKGDKVLRGQKIGTIAQGAPSFLHFEIRKGTQSVDPEKYLQ